MGLETLLAPLPLGIAAGLVVGKQLGIFGAVWGTVKLGLAAKPAGAHVLCNAIDTGGALLEMTLHGQDSQDRYVALELMVPTSMVRMIVSPRSDETFGFGPHVAAKPEPVVTSAAAEPSAAPATPAPEPAATPAPAPTDTPADKSEPRRAGDKGGR